MNKPGLTTGTIVAIRSTPEAESNDIVVARLGDEATLKRFVRKDERTVRLEPESTHKKHRPMTVDLEREDFEVDGVYVGALFGQIQPADSDEEGTP